MLKSIFLACFVKVEQFDYKFNGLSGHVKGKMDEDQKSRLLLIDLNNCPSQIDKTGGSIIGTLKNSQICGRECYGDRL